MLVLSAAAGCESPRPRVTRDSAAGEPTDTADPQTTRFATDATLSIASAGSVAAAMRILSDSFAVREAVQVRRESAAAVGATPSHQRRRASDIVAVDEAALSRRPNAEHVTWYVRFARDQTVPANRGAERDTTPIDSTTVYGLSIPSNAPNPRYAERFIRFVLSAHGERILQAAHLDPLSPPTLVGTKAPPAIVALITAMGGKRLGKSRDTMAAAHPTADRGNSSSAAAARP